MRAFITGVTGFAGSHLAEHLLACGDEVLGSSHRGHWPLGVPDAVQRAVPLIVGDLTTGVDEAARQTVNEFRPDVIFHLAAISVWDDGTDGTGPSKQRRWYASSHRIMSFAR